MIGAAPVLAHKAPALLDELSPAELMVLLFDTGVWLRPEQRVPPPGRWRSFTFVAGRGNGKTFGIVHDLNRGVETGTITQPALLGPNEDDVRDKQVKFLVELSPPWFKAAAYRGGVLWPNGVFAPGRTAEVERPASGDNFDYVWMTEVVKWREGTRVKAFNDITTACRVGRQPRYVVDTTSAGVNDLILRLRDDHEALPDVHLLRRGTIFDNPYLTQEYLVSEIRKYGWGTRVAEEELLGKIFAQVAGAFWQKAWLDDFRREVRPSNPQQTLIAWDPAQGDAPTADEQGICKADLGQDGHVYVSDDLSDRMTPGDAAKIIVAQCTLDVAGVIVETNNIGIAVRQLLEAEARAVGMRVELIDRDAQFPRRTPGRIYVKQYHTAETKSMRATGPAALYSQGKVHHVGTFVRLEREQVTWEPGSRKSPNRLDACAYVVAELAGIAAPVPDGGAAVSDAAEAQRILNDRLRRRGGGRGRFL